MYLHHKSDTLFLGSNVLSMSDLLLSDPKTALTAISRTRGNPSTQSQDMALTCLDSQVLRMSAVSAARDSPELWVTSSHLTQRYTSTPPCGHARYSILYCTGSTGGREGCIMKQWQYSNNSNKAHFNGSIGIYKIIPLCVIIPKGSVSLDSDLVRFWEIPRLPVIIIFFCLSLFS